MRKVTLLPLILLSCRITATPIQATEHVLLSRDNTTIIGISQSLLDDFKLYSNFTAASYCPNNENSTANSLVICPAGVCSPVESDEVTALVEFGGSNDTTSTDIKGFVALDQVRFLIVVAFAGSGEVVRDWLADFDFIQVPYSLCSSCWIHAGFSTGWSERRTIVLDAVTTAIATYPDYELIITGHSIGGAIATLAAAEIRSTLNIKTDTFTFGSPRVGNEAFATFVTGQAPDLGGNYRMTHVNDPVPQLPPTWIGYEHTSPEYWLANGTDTTVDYGVQEVFVCEGIGNEECNAGTGLLPVDGTAHDYYLGDIDACQGPFAF